MSSSQIIFKLFNRLVPKSPESKFKKVSLIEDLFTLVKTHWFINYVQCINNNLSILTPIWHDLHKYSRVWFKLAKQLMRSRRNWFPKIFGKSKMATRKIDQSKLSIQVLKHTTLTSFLCLKSVKRLMKSSLLTDFQKILKNLKMAVGKIYQSQFCI
jgi:hypothetical protein